MPLFLAAFGVFLSSAIPGIVSRVLLSLGLGYAFYTGFNLLADTLLSEIQSLMGQAGIVVNLMGALGVDRAMTIIISAYVAAWSIRSIMGLGKKLVNVDGLGG